MKTAKRGVSLSLKESVRYSASELPDICGSAAPILSMPSPSF
ncbi:hypothetical protein [Coleofasciculus sp. FACHB-T130]|nr:hypothetical protein [Coleofasciculus sp. FACHB-T130]